MYLSLKGSLGHTPITDRVGEGPLQIAEGAAAAYSLRNLGSDSPSVVRVRRESDNNERDFTAQDISTSVLTNWVNEQITPPLDLRELTATGRDGPIIEAAAAYSLRNLSADGTSLTSTGDTQTDYFVFTGATGDTAALNGIKYGYAFLYNGAKAYNSAPPAPENTQMVRGTSGNWTLFDASVNPGKTYANSATNVSTDYPWEADWTGTDLENATFSQQSTGSLVTQVRRNTDGELRSFTASEVTDGTLETWVNTSFANALPLDTAGAAAAAYSLRSLGTNQWSYGGDIDKLDLQTESGGLVGNVTNETATGFDFSVNNEGSTGFKFLLPSANTGNGSYDITFDVQLNSGSLTGCSITNNNQPDSYDQQTLASGSNTFPAIVTIGTGGLYFRTDTTAVADVSITNITLTKTLGDSNYLPAGKYVTQVRRNSDDQVRSFTAAEVTDGTLLAWVNTDIGITFGTAEPTTSGATVTNASSTGFTYSSSSTGLLGARLPFSQPIPAGAKISITLTTSNKVGSMTPSVRLASNSSSQLAASATPSTFTSNANGTQTFIGTTTGTTASLAFFDNVVGSFDVSNVTINYIVYDGTVSKWYDQSGNDNHATQATPASQPKIVSAGSLVTGGIDFDGVNDNLQYNYAITNPTSGSIFSVFNNTATSNSGVVFGIRSGTRDLIQLTSQSESESIIQVRDSGNVLINPSASSPSRLNAQLSSAIFNKATPIYDINVNGGQFSGSSSTVLTGIITASKATIGATDLGTSVSGYLVGTIQEIIYYNSDESDKRRAIEENIGSNYGITLTSSKDGTVSKWYDQSTTSGVPNAKHAVQTSAASQPKIVDGGSLVTGGLDFDGVNDFFQASIGTLTQPISVFSVFKNDSLISGANTVWDSASSSNRIFAYAVGSDDTFRLNAGTALSSSSSAQVDGTTYLRSDIVNSSSSSIRANGSSAATGDAGSNSLEGLTIGARYDGLSNFINGIIPEIIIYDSDQTDNRTALEANIGEVYGIAGIPAYDDTVNGFVETWYDQSGNGNNATQLTAGSQPRIVIDGELIMNAKGFPSIAQYRGGAGTNSNRLFEVNSGLPVSNSTHFAVTQYNRQFSYHLIGTSSAGSSRVGRYSSDQFRISQGGTSVTSGAVFPTSVVKLATVNNAASGGTTTGFVDGVQAFSANLADPSSTGLVYKYLFRGDNDNSGPLLYSEFIYYSSDQSANRPAIDANIINHYDI